MLVESGLSDSPRKSRMFVILIFSPLQVVGSAFSENMLDSEEDSTLYAYDIDIFISLSLVVSILFQFFPHWWRFDNLFYVAVGEEICEIRASGDECACLAVIYLYVHSYRCYYDQESMSMKCFFPVNYMLYTIYTESIVYSEYFGFFDNVLKILEAGESR